MCGIAGALDLESDRSFEASRLGAMLAALAHRGPDGEGTFHAPGIALGARRLALVDPRGGAQPFATPEGDVHAVVNGELYDDEATRSELALGGARFRSRCDAELWPHLHRRHGADMFARVRGQFAVAVWDSARRELLLARDRFGICPLLFAKADGWLLFASEARAIVASGLVTPRPFAPALDALFALYAMPPGATAFEGISSVVPGGMVRASRGRIAASQWWRPRYDAEEAAPASTGIERVAQVRRWEAELEGLLARAVTRRLRGDAKVGAYLSGGVDSSTIATLAGRRGVRDFFHVVPRGAGPDESRAARRTVRDLGGELHELTMDGGAILAALPDAVDAAEHPIVDTSNGCLLRLAADVKRHGMSVALSGEGADECLGGYFWTRLEPVKASLARLLPFDLSSWVRRITTLGIGSPVAALPLDAAQSLVYDPLATARARFFRGDLLASSRQERPIDAWSLPWETLRALPPVRRALYLDTVVNLQGHLLLGKGDRVAMRSAVELRYPFLDEDVWDFSAKLPSSALVRGGRGKRILRSVAARLGVRAATAPKTMFRADRSSLLLGDARPRWVDELLSRESIERAGWFDRVVVERERERRPRHGLLSPRQAVMDACLTLVVTTQLWHHQRLGGGLCSL